MSPATYTAEHLTARSERRMVDFDPDATTLTLVDLDPTSADECLPIAEFRRFLVGVMKSVGTDAIEKVQIIAAANGDGGNAQVVVEKAFTTGAPGAVGDHVWLECDAAQCREVLPGATHVGVRVQLETATDECVVFFERAEPFYPRAGLTADYIAS